MSSNETVCDEPLGQEQEGKQPTWDRCWAAHLRMVAGQLSRPEAVNR